MAADHRPCRTAPAGRTARLFQARAKVPTLILACCLLVSAIPCSSGETVYKWTDADGVTHYGHQPPGAGEAAQQIDLPEDRTAPATAAPGYEAQLERINRRLRVYEEERRLKLERETEAREEKARRDQHCARLRAQVSNYETRGGTWYELDGQGNRRYLDERQLADRIRLLDEAIDQRCH